MTYFDLAFDDGDAGAFGAVADPERGSHHRDEEIVGHDIERPVALLRHLYDDVPLVDADAIAAAFPRQPQLRPRCNFHLRTVVELEHGSAILLGGQALSVDDPLVPRKRHPPLADLLQRQSIDGLDPGQLHRIVFVQGRQDQRRADGHRDRRRKCIDPSSRVSSRSRIRSPPSRCQGGRRTVFGTIPCVGPRAGLGQGATQRDRCAKLILEQHCLGVVEPSGQVVRDQRLVVGQLGHGRRRNTQRPCDALRRRRLAPWARHVLAYRG